MQVSAFDLTTAHNNEMTQSTSQRRAKPTRQTRSGKTKRSQLRNPKNVRPQAVVKKKTLSTKKILLRKNR